MYMYACAPVTILINAYPRHCSTRCRLDKITVTKSNIRYHVNSFHLLFNTVTISSVSELAYKAILLEEGMSEEDKVTRYSN